ncbi:MAG: hypothetical protein Barrevirus19_13 [Barrevirus sp.]|uniref:Uncharacterized protein n=1 Tax=Barrevirus sp. TaxID=2487763 RepID=A0A3G4ZQP0_9VIRU|nr:MAG: hypothetical protein Barrevirus19_13 [Barrevirus sp.]
MTIGCPFCLYINGLSKWKPKLESYYSERDIVPHGFTYMENSGAKLTTDYILIPRLDSDMFDKKLQIIDQNVKNELKFWLNKIICDICLFQIYSENNCVVVDQLDDKEKLFRLFMRHK